MDILFLPFLDVMIAVLAIYKWIIIASVVMFWLINFNVINRKSNAVVMIMDFLYRATEPLYSKIRQILPNTGSFDLSPLVLFIVVWLIQAMLSRLVIKIMVSGV
jgi:YggT family protein